MAVRALVLVLAGLGAGVMIAAELVPLFTVSAGGHDVQTVRAGDHHGYALGLLGLVALALAWAGSRPALAALALVGLVALGVVVVVDRPDATASGFLSGFESARAHARVGLWLGLGGALALVAAAAVGLRAGRR